MTHPKPIKFTTEEGGAWHDWFAGELGLHSRPVINAIMFEDGSIFDAFNGWRKQKYCHSCGGRIALE